MEWLSMEQWSPYAVGIGIGVLCWVAFLFSDKPIGVSTAFTRSSGMIETFFRGATVMERAYYKKFPPIIDWEWMLMIGIMVGAFLSAYLSGELRAVWVPTRWASTFGDNPVLRWLVSLLGGMVIGVGARWAGGCTSGHGISGTLQLAVSSWIAVVAFFLGGIATAFFIFYVV